MCALTTEKSLPPNVTGRCRGILELKVHEIRWRSTAKIFVGVQAKVLWWGENIQSAAILKIDSRKHSSSVNTILYQIKTNSKLFREYTQTCEPIEIKFTSLVSNLQIGTSFVPVPKEIIRFLNLNNTAVGTGLSIHHKSVNQIFSPKNLILGDIVVSFEIHLSEKQSPRLVTPILLSSRREAEHEDVEDAVPTISSSLRDSQKSRRHFKESVNFDKETMILSEKITNKPLGQLGHSKAYGYLSGRKMTKEEEAEALNEIRNISPTGSLIETLSTDALNKSVRCIVDREIVQKIDSIKIKVFSLSLSKAGTRETIRKDAGDSTDAATTFIVECKMSPYLLKTSDRNEGFNAIRFLSDQQSDSHGIIEFEKETIRSIHLPKLEMSDGYKDWSTIQFVIWYRQFGTRQSQLLGSAIVHLKDILDSSDFTFIRNCPVTPSTGSIVLGTLQVQIALGCRGAHFGNDFIDALSYHKENIAFGIHTDPFLQMGSARREKRFDRHDDGHQLQQRAKPIRKCYCSNYVRQGVSPKGCNHDKKEQQDITSTDMEPSTSDAAQSSSSRNASDGSSTSNAAENCLLKVGSTNQEPDAQMLLGLLYLGSLYHSKSTAGPDKNGYFIICRGFWKEDATATEMCENNIFNFLEVFPVVCDGKFFERTQNQFLELELWQKHSDSTEKLIGITSLPLHQFYVAFRDPNVMSHLSRVKLPVISIDGCSNIVTPLTLTVIGKLQVLLAVGTEEQLEYLKAARGIAQSSLSQQAIFRNKMPIPPVRKMTSPGISNAETQTNFSVPPGQDDADIKIAANRQIALSEMLNNFIDNLASRLPERSGQQPEQSTQSSLGSGIQIRRTSDLLDTLQRALMCPPPPPQVSSSAQTSAIPNSSMGDQGPLDFQTKSLEQLVSGLTVSPATVTTVEPHFQVLIEIENALHISKIFIRVNKKCGKQRGRCKPQTYRGVHEVEPSTYVTFEAIGPPTSVVNSNEGPVYTTNVAEKTSSPQWNKRFEVSLPVDLMINDEKRFILKVWRKASTDIPQARLLPNPIEDVVIGFTAIDLSVLLAGMPAISGWYNIVDFSGRINGQIKVNIQPKEDLTKYRQDVFPSFNLGSYTQHQLADSNSYSATTATSVTSTASAPNVMLPLTIDVNTDMNNGTTLSRTLKRKFTELEEITQRLKARLFDVTGDVNIDPDDEFENDLNTNPEEDEDDMRHEQAAAQAVANQQQFDWLRSSYQENNSIFAGQATEFQNNIAATNAFDHIFGGATTLTMQPNTSMYANRTPSGLEQIGSAYSGDPRHGGEDNDKDDDNDDDDDDGVEGNSFNWERILQEHDVDTIINSNIFNKLLKPSHVSTTSDESAPRRIIVPDVDDSSGDASSSSDPDRQNVDQTTEDSGSSSSEQDRIRLISTALQKAVISDEVVAATATVPLSENAEASLREAPEGATNSLKE